MFSREDKTVLPLKPQDDLRLLANRQPNPTAGLLGDFQQVLALYVEGKRITDIATLLGKSAPQVSSIITELRHAMKAGYKSVAEYWGDGRRFTHYQRTKNKPLKTLKNN